MSTKTKCSFFLLRIPLHQRLTKIRIFYKFLVFMLIKHFAIRCWTYSSSQPKKVSRIQEKRSSRRWVKNITDNNSLNWSNRIGEYLQQKASIGIYKIKPEIIEQQYCRSFLTASKASKWSDEQIRTLWSRYNLVRDMTWNHIRAINSDIKVPRYKRGNWIINSQPLDYHGRGRRKNYYRQLKITIQRSLCPKDHLILKGRRPTKFPFSPVLLIHNYSPVLKMSLIQVNHTVTRITELNQQK